MMTLALVGTAFADDAITITVNNSTEKAHTYYAYQVFSGSVEEIGGVKKLVNIDWGTGVTGTASILSELASNMGITTGWIR